MLLVETQLGEKIVNIQRGFCLFVELEPDFVFGCAIDSDFEFVETISHESEGEVVFEGLFVGVNGGLESLRVIKFEEDILFAFEDVFDSVLTAKLVEKHKHFVEVVRLDMRQGVYFLIPADFQPYATFLLCTHQRVLAIYHPVESIHPH